MAGLRLKRRILATAPRSAQGLARDPILRSFTVLSQSVSIYISNRILREGWIISFAMSARPGGKRLIAPRFDWRKTCLVGERLERAFPGLEYPPARCVGKEPRHPRRATLITNPGPIPRRKRQNSGQPKVGGAG